MTTTSAQPTINKYGVKKWLNNNGQLHRTDGPAVIYPDGTKEYWINGQRQHG